MIKLKGVTFRGLQKLSVAERVRTVRSSGLGSTIISALTPSQFADLFPLYYRRQLPDISGFLKAVPSSVSQKRAAFYDEQIQRTVKGAAAGTGMPKFDAAVNSDISRRTARVLKKGEVPLPQLSPEQLATYNAIKAGQMDVNDPKAAFLKNLNDDQLKSAGLSKVKDESGKEVFKYMAPVVSDIDVKKSLSVSDNAQSIVKAAKFAGVDPKDLAAVMHYESAGTMSTSKWGGTGGNYLGLIQFGPAERAKYGVYPGQSFDEQAMAAAKFLNDRGLKTWLQNHPDATVEQRRTALYSTINAGRPDEKYWTRSDNGGRDNVITHTQRIFSEHYSAAERIMAPVDSITRDYSKEALEAQRQSLVRQIETNQISSLAQFTSSQQKDIVNSSDGTIAGPGQAINKNTTHVIDRNGFIQPVDSSLYTQRNSQQCATLSKAFNPSVGAASTWKVGGSSGIGPGVMVATQRYNDGSGGRVHAGYHTGIALSKPDADGNFLMLEQFNGQPARVTKTNVNHYGPGNSYGVVAGGEKPSLSALSVGASLSSGADREIITQNMNALAGSNVKTADTNAAEMKKVLPPSADPAETVVKVNQGGKPDYMVTSPDTVPEQSQKGPIEIAPSATTVQPAENLQEQPTAKPIVKEPEAPKSTTQRFNVNQSAFIAKIKEMDWRANMASDKMIIDGFNDDPQVKAAGVHLDNKGVMHIKDMNNPAVKQIMQDMDTSKFMTPIKEEPKPVQKAPEVPKAPQPAKAPEVPKAPQPAKAPEAPKPLSEAAKATPTPTQNTPETKTDKAATNVVVKPESVPTKVVGGTTKAAPQITAYPIGGLRDDNTVVVDANQKPLFTMNTNKEAVVPTGAHNQVNIIPSQKGPEGGLSLSSDPMKEIKGDIEQLKQQMNEASLVPKGSQNVSGVKPRGVVADRDPQMINQLLDQIGQPYKNPTAQRAFSRARFVETGDATNDFHHSTGNSTQRN